MAEQLRPRLGKQKKLTRLETAIVNDVNTSGVLNINEYQLFKIVYQLYRSSLSLYLRSDEPSLAEFRQLAKRMERKGAIRFDPDYRSKLLSFYPYRNLSVEEACCTVDPFAYISHMSAMQQYGLTERRPKSLYLTTLAPAAFKKAASDRMTSDYWKLGFDVPSVLVKLTSTTHPVKVRGQVLSVSHVREAGGVVEVRSSKSRISTIGQTFLDMLERPRQCGGMKHVIAVWVEHAAVHIDQIIGAVNQRGSKIAKVRAGYILVEVMGMEHERIQQWRQFAQRGGSRVLDPEKPFGPEFSEDWMISINV